MRAAGTRDPGAFCAASSSPAMCENQWNSAGGAAAVPRTPPAVVGSRAYVGGVRVLHVCGTDGRGKPYATDFVVETAAGGPRASLPVYWSRLPFSGVYVDGELVTSGNAPDRTALCEGA